MVLVLKCGSIHIALLCIACAEFYSSTTTRYVLFHLNSFLPLLQSFYHIVLAWYNEFGTPPTFRFHDHSFFVFLSPTHFAPSSLSLSPHLHSKVSTSACPPFLLICFIYISISKIKEIFQRLRPVLFRLVNTSNFLFDSCTLSSYLFQKSTLSVVQR